MDDRLDGSERTFLRVVERLARFEREASASRYQYPDPAADMEEAAFPLEKREEERELWGAFLHRAVGAERPAAGVALDAGCGLGAHLPLLTAAFRHVVAIDADPRRLSVAKARSGSVGARFGAFVVPLESPVLLDPALRGAFSVVHCVQVLGHVPRARFVPALERFVDLLAPGGSLILAVPYTNEPADDFRVAVVDEKGHLYGAPSSPAEFDRLAVETREGMLPVRHFAMPTIEGALRSVGLWVEHHRPYNWFSEQRADLFVLAKKRRTPGGST